MNVYSHPSFFETSSEIPSHRVWLDVGRELCMHVTMTPESMIILPSRVSTTTYQDPRWLGLGLGR